MLGDDEGDFSEEFLRKIESEGLAEDSEQQLQKLTTEQRQRLAELLVSRRAERSKIN